MDLLVLAITIPLTFLIAFLIGRVLLSGLVLAFRMRREPQLAVANAVAPVADRLSRS